MLMWYCPDPMTHHEDYNFNNKSLTLASKSFALKKLL